METQLCSCLEKNITTLKKLLPIDTSFDLVTRTLYLGDTPAFWLGVNGFCKTEILQQIFSDLQFPLYTEDEQVVDIEKYMNAKIGYAQTTLTSSWDEIIRNVLSGPSVLFIEGFDKAILLDVRTYPTRGVTEPDVERVTRGARDGFVETMLFNTNLIRRRVRSKHLTFAIHNVGTESRTDVAVAYLADRANEDLLHAITDALDNLSVTSLTMGTKSLEELLVAKRWCNPLPSLQVTERPDVACSYLLEGHILLIVDNSPLVLILPGTIFQFTQSPEDYYKSPTVGTYFRLIRFFCIPVSLTLMPLFLLLTAYYPAFSAKWNLIRTPDMAPARIIFYVLTVEFILDLFKYSTAISSSRFSGALSIVGGLIIGDIAINLNWATPEIFFYGAITLLASLSISSMEFSDGLRVYRVFLLFTTALWGIYGFFIGLVLILISMATTPTFGGMSYLWPLFPFNKNALKRLLFRCSTPSAQPCKVWNRGKLHWKKSQKNSS